MTGKTIIEQSFGNLDRRLRAPFFVARAAHIGSLASLPVPAAEMMIRLDDGDAHDAGYYLSGLELRLANHIRICPFCKYDPVFKFDT